MLVKAIRKGYYGEKRRIEGDVFTIKGGVDFSDSEEGGWMEAVDKEAAKVAMPQKPARVQNPQDPRDMNKVVEDTLGDESVLNNGSGVKPSGSTGNSRQRTKAQRAEADASAKALAGDGEETTGVKGVVNKVKHAFQGDSHGKDGHKADAHHKGDKSDKGVI